MNRLTKMTLAAGILTAMQALAGSAPATDPAELETATFSMYCYWTGEATLGRVEGVVASRIGHWGGAEIVQVDYDPSRTDLAKLVGALESQRSFYSLLVETQEGRQRAEGRLGAGKVSEPSGRLRFIEPKHSLRTLHPELAALSLTEAQAIALNSWSYFGGAMPDVLTPEQERRLRR